MTTMDFSTTLNALRKLCVETGSLACLGCGHEHNCSAHGCAILRNAIEHIEAALSNYDSLSALSPPNEPLTQADLDSMDYDTRKMLDKQASDKGGHLMKCRDCEKLEWGYDEGERVWWCAKRGHCPDLDVERNCSEFSLKKPDIFTALSTLQAENEKLWATVDNWKKKYVEANGKLIEAENKWAGLDKAVRNGTVYRPMQEELNLTHKENQLLKDANEKLWAELEQVKRDFDGICEYIDSEGFLRKQFCENGNPDLEPCICPSLQEHSGYIDSDDCEGCDHFCNSWRGKKEE